MPFCMRFSLICPSCPFQNLLYDQKHTLFSNFARFCTPKRCTRVHRLVLKNNPYMIFFLHGQYPTSNTSAPPGYFHNICHIFRTPYTIVTQHELMRLFEGDIKTDILNSTYCSIFKEHFDTKTIFISYSYQKL